MSTREYESRRSEQPVSGWALGATTFAATILLLAGAFQAVVGLVAVLDEEFFVVAGDYTFDLDVTAWGWIHLLLGVALLATGIGLLARAAWAAATAIVLCLLSAMSSFFFIPYFPIWALVVIALDVWVIWALLRPGTIRA